MTTLEERFNHRLSKSRAVAISGLVDSPVIVLKNVSKTYIVHHEKPTLAEDFGKWLKREKNKEFQALNKINLKIFPGEKVGFYGPNGVGKSTLLKLIAGICRPTTGSVETIGRIVSLIDLEAGFHPDLTGEENILLNGLIIGMSKQEILQELSKIIAFADLGDFINAPLYTYSSGMKLRLGFSVAIHAHPDILILDEVIAAGDENFRQKTEKVFDDMFKNDKTILVVSHWLEFLEKNCSRLICLKKN